MVMSLSHPLADSSDLSSAPGAAASHQRVNQTHTGAPPWVLGWCFCHPLLLQEIDGHHAWHCWHCVSPMLGRQCGHWGRGIGAVWQKAGNGCQNKNFKKGEKDLASPSVLVILLCKQIWWEEEKGKRQKSSPGMEAGMLHWKEIKSQESLGLKPATPI